MLGNREKDIYGNESLDHINNNLREIAGNNNFDISFFQSNHEGELVDYIQDNFNKWDGLIINPGGLTHTSVVLRDTVLLLDIPIIEVHLSNIYAREEFRQKSLLKDIVTGFICGLGSFGYISALNYLIQKSN
jgi:3-dehydroquinate dehydratase-2